MYARDDIPSSYKKKLLGTTNVLKVMWIIVKDCVTINSSKVFPLLGHSNPLYEREWAWLVKNNG